ncbi:hypothetical protein E6H16_10000 [Candidatus Bathyarchaeota archaeon]|nr:MAG: hypothetical protein E6H16_10000 [Candidatus Bathyarchaeota archaeon]
MSFKIKWFHLPGSNPRFSKTAVHSKEKAHIECSVRPAALSATSQGIIPSMPYSSAALYNATFAAKMQIR